MAESQYSYGTSILTSKTPQEAAAILPSSINATQGLLENNLLGWFNEYTQLLQRHNQALNQLLQNGSKIFGQQQNKEYEGFHKVWNCLLSSLQVEIHSNETLFKNLKLEAIGPLKDVFQKDVRYSELLVNSQELQEISGDLSRNGSNAEMQWNMKAPQIFDNFENFKKFETQLLFDVSYSLLNGLNTKYTKNLSNNENSVNYVLNGYKIDTEMASYLQYLLQKKDFAPASLAPLGVGAPGSRTNPRQSRQVSHSDLNSMNSSATSGSANTSLKKPSKLKSKMGSIFGRKNKLKRTSGLGSGTIPETESVTSSVNNNARLNKSTDSIDNLAQNNVNRTSSVRDSRRTSELDPSVRQSFDAQQYQESPLEHQQVPQQRVPQQQVPQQQVPQQQVPQQQVPQQQVPQQQVPQQQVPQQRVPQQQVPQQQVQKQQVQQPQIASLNAAPLTPKPISENRQVADSPNIVKYESETSDDDFEDPNNKGNRLSMLQRHSLSGPENGSPSVDRFSNETDPQYQQQGQEPSGLLSVGQHDNGRHAGRLSQSSAGKYSFEAGDEENSMNATPKQQQNIFEEKVGELNINDNSGSSSNNHFLRNAAVASGAGIAGAAAMGNMHGHNQQQEQPQQEQQYQQQSPQQFQQYEPQQQDQYEYYPEQYQDTQQYQQPSFQSQRENQEAQLFMPQQQSESQYQQENQQSTDLLQQKGSGLPPPPPKARKVLHRESSLRNQSTSSPRDAPSLVSVPSNSTDSRANRRDIHSQMFHNLPNARASVLQQPTLVSQDTGNSLLRNSDYFKHFDSTSYVESNGLNSSIAEVINVNIKNDKLMKSQLIGEIAFNYKKQLNEQIEPIIVRIPNQFDKIILNNTYIEKLSNEEFNINPELIVSKTLGGMKYLKSITFEEVPILIQQIWKFEDHQSSLMISLKLNPNYSNNLVINNLVISVALDPSCKTINASSRPQGSFNKDKNRITWRYTQPLNLSTNNLEEKLIARFATNGIGSEHESGIQVKFSIHDPPHQPNILNSRNEPIPCVKNLITGSYSSHS